MHSRGIAARRAALHRGKIGIDSSHIDGIRIGTMTFEKKRAFHFGGASWLLLCAVADTRWPRTQRAAFLDATA